MWNELQIFGTNHARAAVLHASGDDNGGPPVEARNAIEALGINA